MKKVFLLVTSILVASTLSAQTLVFNIQEFKAKEFSQSDIAAAYETCCADVKPNKGGYGVQEIGKGADGGMTHRLIWYWEMGEDLWEGTNIWDKVPLWSAQMNNYVEEWGEPDSGRVLSRQVGTDEDYVWSHIWDIKIDNPNQFKIAHDKIVEKFKKEFTGRRVGFGTYDINYPNGATHWVGVSGKDDHDHSMLYHMLETQSEFVKMAAERGKFENVRDYMVKDIITY